MSAEPLQELYALAVRIGALADQMERMSLVEDGPFSDITLGGFAAHVGTLQHVANSLRMTHDRAVGRQARDEVHQARHWPNGPVVFGTASQLEAMGFHRTQFGWTDHVGATD